MILRPNFKKWLQSFLYRINVVTATWPQEWSAHLKQRNENCLTICMPSHQESILAFYWIFIFNTHVIKYKKGNINNRCLENISVAVSMFMDERLGDCTRAELVFAEFVLHTNKRCRLSFVCKVNGQFENVCLKRKKKTLDVQTI